jgi:hypothetical protein
MSEYREIQGVAVENKSGSTGTKEGQIYYDTSTNEFKLIGAGGVETLTTE